MNSWYFSTCDGNESEKRVFFSASLPSFSPLSGLTLTACWSEPWLGIFANSSLVLLLAPPPLSPPSSSFHFCSPDSHTRLIVSLGGYKPCSRSQFSERRGLSSSLSLRLTRKTLSKNPHEKGGREVETVEKDNGKVMERLEREGGTGYRVSQGHPIQLQIQKTSCTFFSLPIVVAFCS